MKKALIAQHNLSTLEIYDKLGKEGQNGSIPLPSIAITTNDNPLESFGKITLLFEPAMFDSTNSLISPCDSYSCRMPRLIFNLDSKKQDMLSTELKWLFESLSLDADHNYEAECIVDYFNQGMAGGLRGCEHNLYLKALYLSKCGINITPDKDQEDNTASYQSLSKEIQKHEIRDRKKYIKFLETLFSNITLDPKVNVSFFNHSRSGYEKAEIHKIAKAMQRSIKADESSGTSVARFRAAITPNLKSIDEVSKLSGKMVSKVNFDKIGDALEREFEALADEMAEYNNCFEDVSFTGMDEILADIVSENSGIATNLDKIIKVINSEYGGLSDELIERFTDFYTKIQDLDTAYFEVKFKDVLSLDSVKVAIVPDDIFSFEMDILKKNSIPFVKYDRSGLSNEQVSVNYKKACMVAVEKYNLGYGDFGDLVIDKELKINSSVLLP